MFFQLFIFKDGQNQTFSDQDFEQQITINNPDLPESWRWFSNFSTDPLKALTQIE